jgi:hypothetical protein
VKVHRFCISVQHQHYAEVSQPSSNETSASSLPKYPLCRWLGKIQKYERMYGQKVQSAKLLSWYSLSSFRNKLAILSSSAGCFFYTRSSNRNANVFRLNLTSRFLINLIFIHMSSFQPTRGDLIRILFYSWGTI